MCYFRMEYDTKKIHLNFQKKNKYITKSTINYLNAYSVSSLIVFERTWRIRRIGLFVSFFNYLILFSISSIISKLSSLPFFLTFGTVCALFIIKYYLCKKTYSKKCNQVIFKTTHCFFYLPPTNLSFNFKCIFQVFPTALFIDENDHIWTPYNTLCTKTARRRSKWIFF